ncbi:MAG TPA: class I SAM-dependent methyltransferase [Acidimicrobiales bacterium]|nr:class I SAM-dependent methyltransferase [Acidimicrobiales bacterium]
MAVRERVTRWVISQFRNPRGLGGHVTGWIMGHRPSNVQRNRWVVSLLDLSPTDRILEVGFGPGVALRELARLAPHGYVCGIDRSEVMVRQARRRNAAAVRAGVLDIRAGTAEDVPQFDRPFDRVMAVNSLGFWQDPEKRLEELRKVLRPGGLIAIASQPRCPGATAATSDAAAGEIVALLDAVGFDDLRVERLDLQPPVICVLGRC